MEIPKRHIEIDFEKEDWKEQGTSCPTCGSKSAQYNGWNNYETWCVALWLGNEESSHTYWAERAQEIVNTIDAGTRFGTLAHLFSNEDAQVAELAAELQESHDQERPDMGGVFLDLLTSALSSVDWREIARSYISECGQPASVEDEDV